MSKIVFRVQLSLFLKERGMLVFYALCILVTGVLPLFTRSLETALSVGALMPTLFLKPLLADSVAGEREHHTLESLLSSPLNGKAIVYGKMFFCLSFALFFFSLQTVLAAFTIRVSGYGDPIPAWRWTAIALMAVLSYGAICEAGAYMSATSADLRTANSRIARMAYLVGMVFLSFLPIALTANTFTTLFVGAVFALAFLVLLVIYSLLTARMSQASFFEETKKKSRSKRTATPATLHAPQSQFGIVLRHELKYVLTLKPLLRNFALLSFAPALLVCLLPFSGYYDGAVDLNQAVLVTALLVPRIPVNLIAYSIGGEKVYKTGESLLSTPLGVRPVFLAKCTVPVLVSMIILPLSTSATLVGVNLIAASAPKMVPVTFYNAEQLIFLFPASLLTCILMILLTGILSYVLKLPRYSLYVNSLLSFLFVIPTLSIINASQGSPIRSITYCALLLLVDLTLLAVVSGRTNRSWLMARL